MNKLFNKKSKKQDNNFKTYAMNSSRPKVTLGEFFLKFFVYLIAAIVVALLLIIIIYVAVKSGHIFSIEGFFQFIFTDRWMPGNDAAFQTGAAYYGIGGIIASTLMMLVIALLFSVPLTLFSALFISEYMGKKSQKFVMTAVQLLAGVPSVVFGLFAIDQIGPWFISMGAKTNGNMMTAAFTLSFMALPTMLSLSFNALQNVPDGYRFASLGLGISKEQTTFSVVRKSATPKIISAVIMGMARVVGETMAVILIAGNSAEGLKAATSSNSFFFASIKTLAGTIGLEMLENAGPDHESALYAIGLVLFFLVIIINLSILIISNADVYKRRRMEKRKRTINKKSEANYSNYELATIVKTKSSNKLKKRAESGIAWFFMATSTVIVLAFICWIVGVVVVKGLIGLQYADAFIHVNGQDGIFAALFTTILLIISTLIFAIPLSLGTAIYLSEFARKKSPVTKTLRFLIDVLASTPSIVFGIFGLSVLIIAFKLPMSIFASSLIMTLVVIPMLTSNFEDALAQVPQSYKEASYGLGNTKAQTLIKVTLPNAAEGLVTGVILAIAKIIGETAPVYLTLGTAVRMPREGFLASGATLTTEIYMLTSEGGGSNSIEIAYLFSLVTILLQFGLNYLSTKVSFGTKSGTWAQRQKEKWHDIIHFDYNQWFKELFDNIKEWWQIIKLRSSKKYRLEQKEQHKLRKQILKDMKKEGDS